MASAPTDLVESTNPYEAVPRARDIVEEIASQIEAEVLTTDMVDELYALQANMAMRLVQYRDVCAPGKVSRAMLDEMADLEERIDVLLEAIESDDEPLLS